MKDLDFQCLFCKTFNPLFSNYVQECQINILLGLFVCSLNQFFNPTSIYLFESNNGNNRKMSGICSKLTIKTPKRRHWLRSDVFIVNFKQIPHIVLRFPFLTYNKQPQWEILKETLFSYNISPLSFNLLSTLHFIDYFKKWQSTFHYRAISSEMNKDEQSLKKISSKLSRKKGEMREKRGIT